MPDHVGLDKGPATKSLTATRVLRALPAAPSERVRQARRLRFGLITARIIADGALLIAAFIVAYSLRYGIEFGRDIVAPESFKPLSDFYPYIAAYVAITLVVFQVRGLYRLPRGATWLDHMRVVIGAALIGVSALTLGALLFNPVLPSRLVFIFLWVSTLVLFGVER